MRVHRALAVTAWVFVACGSTLVAAYPELFVEGKAANCYESPTQAYGEHGAPVADPSIAITVSSADGAAVTTLCPGGKYNVQVRYPQPRRTLLVVGGHSSKLTDANGRCGNRKHSTLDEAPSTGFTAALAIPCIDSTDTKANLVVTSSQEATTAFQQAKLTAPVAEGSSAQCAALCSGGAATAAAAGIAPASAADPSAIVVPVSGSTAEANVAIDVVPGDAAGGSGIVYYSKPVIKGNKQLMQYLHAGLMMGAFCLLMPLGALLARHKWMFGSVEGKVSSAWFGTHLSVQLGGLACAIAGVVLAILSFGLKKLPMYALFAPHQWMGLAIMGMALVQLVVGAVRPQLGSKGRRGWNLLHAWWGRLTLAAGVANVFIGIVLMHDMKGAPYVYWLTPAAVCVGLLILLALLLESLKVQYQRTHRYNPKTHQLFRVWDGHNVTAKRSGGDAAQAYAVAGPAAIKPAPSPLGGQQQQQPLTVGVTASSSRSDMAAAPAPAPEGAFPPPQDALFPPIDPEAGLRPVSATGEAAEGAHLFPRVAHT